MKYIGIDYSLIEGRPEFGSISVQTRFQWSIPIK